KATNCIRCGECIEKCPQNLDIMDLLEEVSEYFGE
ncbi:MAG: 4Fe-4S dicluster domain-containing protein, partial [Candidatus Thermoplasmatota archaeon]